MNTIALLGTLSSAPELAFSQDGLAYLSAELSFPSGKPDEADYQMRLVAFGKLAEEANGTLTCGDTVIVEGRLQVETKARPDGSKHRAVELVARKLSRLPMPGLVPAAPAPPAAQPAHARSQQGAARPVRRPVSPPVTDDVEF